MALPARPVHAPAMPCATCSCISFTAEAAKGRLGPFPAQWWFRGYRYVRAVWRARRGLRSHQPRLAAGDARRGGAAHARRARRREGVVETRLAGPGGGRRVGARPRVSVLGAGRGDGGRRQSVAVGRGAGVLACYCTSCSIVVNSCARLRQHPDSTRAKIFTSRPAVLPRA